MENNIDKVIWYWLPKNEGAIELIKNNLDKLDPTWLSLNKNIFEYDYNYIQKITNFYKDELLEITLEYKRLSDWVYTNEERKTFNKFWNKN